MIRILSATALCLWCAACASSGGEAKSAQSETQTEMTAPTGNGLEAQSLAPGECGLFLWTLAEPRTFVFFSKAGTESALISLGGKAARMSQSSADGEIFGQFMTDMQYEPLEDEGTLNVFIEPGTLLEQGQRTETARLTFTDPEGWETIVPVAGVRACQNE